jgi:PAS domain S-box-containing protein
VNFIFGAIVELAMLRTHILQMSKSKAQSLRVFKTVKEVETGQDHSPEITQDALNILHDAINSSTSGLIITNFSGDILFANLAFFTMFDYSINEITGKKAADLFATREVRSLSDVITKIDISNDDTEQFVVEKKGGEHFVVEVMAVNVVSGSGQLVGRMASFVDITKRNEIEADRERLINELQDALSNFKKLNGIIHICSSCKKIKDEKGYWNGLESYLTAHSDAKFSHLICPECVKKLYPDFY